MLLESPMKSIFAPPLSSILKSRRLLAVLLLGFSSGLPLALTGATLQAWMTTENVDLTVIGLFSLVGLPYALKFLWAPLMDRYVPPFLGRRRGWILVTQIAVMISVIMLALVKPSHFPGTTAFFALLVAFFSASQDVVVDAYRTDVLAPSELGPGAGLHITGYRIAMLVSGSVALMLSDHISWKLVYFAMSLFMIIGMVTTVMAPEPTVQVRPPHSLREAAVLPFVEFLKRRGAFEILGFILLYKLDVVLATALTTPFIMGLGFSRTDIGVVTKGFGLVATVVGSLAGGMLLPKLGMKRGLFFFGIFQGVSTYTFWMLARAGHDYPLMVSSIAVENFCSGMGNAAFFAFLMSVCDKRYTATQFALLSSFMALTRIFGGAPSGYLVKMLGWENFYILCIFIMIPGLLLLSRFSSWQKAEQMSTEVA
jgi:MFS transporter, PAT family, beta-lactamase induction signal transducer AmpG